MSKEKVSQILPLITKALPVFLPAAENMMDLKRSQTGVLSVYAHTVSDLSERRLLETGTEWRFIARDKSGQRYLTAGVWKRDNKLEVVYAAVHTPERVNKPVRSFCEAFLSLQSADEVNGGSHELRIYSLPEVLAQVFWLYPVREEGKHLFVPIDQVETRITPTAYYNQLVELAQLFAE
jgi:hypothetical protein